MADITLPQTGRGPLDKSGKRLSPLDALAARSAWSATRLLAWLVMALLASGVVWAFFAELEQVSIANGEVVPQGKLKVVQHLEGGMIQRLFVQEGDVVKEGAPLLQLDLAVTSINKE